MADFKEENANYIEIGKKEVQKTKEIENSAETAVKNLEKDQTQANLVLATSKVDAVTDADKKEKFQKRIATVKTAIEAKKEKELEDKAETAVKNLENNQSCDNIDDAKNKVNAVNNSTKKEAFNNRINAVVSAIETKEAEEVAQAEEARKAEEARQAEETARQAQEQAAAEEAARQQAAARQVQQQAASRYSRDARGRWHHPNLQKLKLLQQVFRGKQFNLNNFTKVVRKSL